MSHLTPRIAAEYCPYSPSLRCTKAAGPNSFLTALSTCSFEMIGVYFGLVIVYILWLGVQMPPNTLFICSSVA